MCTNLLIKKKRKCSAKKIDRSLLTRKGTCIFKCIIFIENVRLTTQSRCSQSPTAPLRSSLESGAHSAVIGVIDMFVRVGLA